MIISKKKYEAAIKEAVDKELGKFWRDKEREDMQRHYNNDLLKLHNEIMDLRRIIGITVSELAKKFENVTFEPTRIPY